MKNNSPYKASRRQASRKRILAEKKGRWAENLACLMLMAQGFRILERRYQPRHRGMGGSEIDIIARRFRLVIFVEVKQRAHAGMMDVLTPRQCRQITQTARFFLAKLPDADRITARFDAIFFGRRFWPYYVANAWSDDGHNQ